MPPPPPVEKRRPWVPIAVAVLLTAVVVGVVSNLAGGSTAEAAPSTVPTVAPTTPPSTAPLPQPVADPLDAPMEKLHNSIFVQQFCNMVDRSGIDYFAHVIDIGSPWRSNSIGSAWVVAQNSTGDSISELATEFYGRYC
jgi:hypothetical protein